MARERVLLGVSVFREYLYPPGRTAPVVARLDGALDVWVNFCEAEGASLYFGIPFEPHEQHAVRNLVSPGDVFLDVGANIGQYSLIASRLVGPEGTVHAFEPAPATGRMLLKNVRLNGLSNVVVNRMAVSDRAGDAELLVNRESGLTSLGRTGRGEVVGVERVPCITLDAYIEQHSIGRVGFLKVDVEGYEGHVLRGAQDLLEREEDLVVMCELAEKNLGPLRQSRDRILDWIGDRGYEVWQINSQTGGLVDCGRNGVSDRDQNFVFARPSLARRIESLQAAG